MAQETMTIGNFAGGLVLAQIDFNNANGNINKARVINNSASPAHFEAVLAPPVNGWSTIGMDAPANATTENNLPNNTVKFTKDADGNWSLPGVSLFCRWPA